MAKRQPANGDSGGNEMLLFFGLGLIGFMLWMAYHTKIAALVLGVRGAEAWVISLFTYQLEEVRAFIKYVPRKAVTAGQLFEVSTVVGKYTRWVSMPILLGLGVWLYRRSPTERFKRIYSDKTLPIAVAKLYPWMEISVKLDFSKMDSDKGNWACARTERQFTRLHKLRDERGALDRDRAAAVFIKQLGGLWLGYSSLKPHARALFALFATRMNKDFAEGDKLLLQLARSAAAGKMDYSNVDRLAKKYMESKSVKAVISQHAYERTVLMSMLDRARGGESGKDYLPPNWFLWLKGLDRSLWYCLADVGRKTYHVESAGVFAHWLTERARKKPLSMPWVKNAIDGLATELAKLTNDDDTDEGLVDSDDLLEPESLPPSPDMPTPEEAEIAFKTKIPWFSKK